MSGLWHKKLVGKQIAARGETTQRSNSPGVNSERSGANGINSRSGDGISSQRSSAATINSQMSTGVARSSAIGSKRASEDQVRDAPPKRGRGKMSRTQLKLPPRGGKVELEPVGDSQFIYSPPYHPKGYKYPSQVGAILKRIYPGVITIYDDDGNEVAKRPTFSWNDYYCKRNGRGNSYAKLVKIEFWNLFTVKLSDRRHAERNLENYLVRRVTNTMSQARLEAIKKYFFSRNEECDDARARTEELTEAQFLIVGLSGVIQMFGSSSPTIGHLMHSSKREGDTTTKNVFRDAAHFTAQAALIYTRLCKCLDGTVLIVRL